MRNKILTILLLPIIAVCLVIMCIKRKNEKIIEVAEKTDIFLLDYDFIKKFETGNGKPILVVFKNKMDGNLECGYGHVVSSLTWSVGDKISEQQAEEFFAQDIRKAFSKYGSALNWDSFSDNQKRAIISFSYNTIGKSETLIKYANAGKWKELAEWMPNHYITSDGKEYSGLVRRRQYEAELMLS